MSQRPQCRAADRTAPISRSCGLRRGARSAPSSGRYGQRPHTCAQAVHHDVRRLGRRPGNRGWAVSMHVDSSIPPATAMTTPRDTPVTSPRETNNRVFNAASALPVSAQMKQKSTRFAPPSLAASPGRSLRRKELRAKRARGPCVRVRPTRTLSRDQVCRDDHLLPTVSPTSFAPRSSLSSATGSYPGRYDE